MGEERLPEKLQTQLEQALRGGGPSAGGSRRRVFREMAKGEIEGRPLSWGRRRALVRFGQHLGMDVFEARLLIRAIEYECGHVAPAAMADVRTRAEAGYLARPGHPGISLHIGVAVVIGVLLCLVIFGPR